MKKLVVLSIALAFLGCKSSERKESNSKDSKELAVTVSEVKETVAFLASDELLGRNTGSQGIDESATYIEEQMKSFGLKPYFETYRDSFKAKEMDAFNVVGYLEGNDEKLKGEVVIIGAHYDHIGYGKTVENDSIANGANDNAAGSSAVLAMARHFSAKKNNKRSLMFVLFSAEEMGLLGSKHLAKRLKSEDMDLYTVFNIEMLGTPMKDKEFDAYITGHKFSNMSEKINEYTNDSKFIGFYEMAETYNLFKRSDNYPFYEEFNVPAQTISTSDDYVYYHHVDDEVDKLDYDHMARIINKIIPAIEKMSNTPTREIKMYD